MRLWVGILFYYFIILLFWGQLPGVSAMPWPARDGDGDCEDDDDDGEWWKSEIIIMLVGVKKKRKAWRAKLNQHPLASEK